MSTLCECRYLEYNFLVQSGDFCILEYKIRLCKEVYIFPYPKIVIFKNLEKYRLHLFYSFLCLQQQYIFGYVYKIKFNKIKTYLFQCHVAHSLHQNEYNQTHMKTEKICYNMDIAN